MPQCSILKSLLFIIFINIFANDLNVEFLSNPDDMKLFCEIRSLNNCLSRQQNLHLSSFWCRTNKLLINPNKCSTMAYFRKESLILFTYSIDSVRGRPEFVRDLVSTLTQNCRSQCICISLSFAKKKKKTGGSWIVNNVMIFVLWSIRRNILFTRQIVTYFITNILYIFKTV